MSSDYCTEANMNALFGAKAITRWSDIDGDADATKKAARISEAIDAASDDIDDALRTGKYSNRLPIKTAADATPASITRLAAVLAGLWLYAPKALADADKGNSTPHLVYYQNWATQKLDDIRRGKIELDAVS